MPAGVGCHGNRTISSIWEGGKGEKCSAFGLLLLKHKCRTGGACWLISPSLWPQWRQLEVSERSRDYIIVKDIIWSNAEIISEAFSVQQSIG